MGAVGPCAVVKGIFKPDVPILAKVISMSGVGRVWRIGEFVPDNGAALDKMRRVIPRYGADDVEVRMLRGGVRVKAVGLQVIENRIAVLRGVKVLGGGINHSRAAGCLVKNLLEGMIERHATLRLDFDGSSGDMIDGLLRPDTDSHHFDAVGVNDNVRAGAGDVGEGRKPFDAGCYRPDRIQLSFE